MTSSLNLKQIAELQPGVYLKANENVVDKAYFLGIKDFDEHLNLQKPPAEVDKSKVREKYIVKNKHVLFSTRLKFNAFTLPESDDVYVTSNSFILIKPDTEQVYPGYLRWFLNHPNTQKQLKLFTQGTSRMPYISRKKLGGITVDLPEMTVQKNIAALYDLLTKEKILTQKLIVKREEYLQAQLFKRAKNE